MKKYLKALILAMLCIVLVVPAMNMNVSAATQRQKAIAAYQKYMAQSKVYIMPKGVRCPSYSGGSYAYNGTAASKASFCIANIDSDSIPELVISGPVGPSNIPSFTILTYKNGKIRRIKYETEAAFHGYYSKTGIYIEHHYTEGTLIHIFYNRLKGLKTNQVLYKGDWGRIKYLGPDYADTFRIGNKSCSAKTFAAYRKKITGGKSLIKVKFYKNTASNRKLKLR